jgi:hypothetical protein
MTKRVTAKAKKVQAKKAVPKAATPARVEAHPAAMVLLSTLKSHPKNYRVHPEDQLQHIIASIKEHGLYRNIVVARDGTILAGHGVVAAAKKMGLAQVSVVKLDLDPDDPRALKLLAGDNEIGRLAEVDRKMLADLLGDLKGLDGDDLLGTGYGILDLDRLVASLGSPIDVTAEWAGMPEFNQQDNGAFRQILVSFKSDEDAEKFAKVIGQSITKDTRALWFPEAEIIHVADKRYLAK